MGDTLWRLVQHKVLQARQRTQWDCLQVFGDHAAVGRCPQRSQQAGRRGRAQRHHLQPRSVIGQSEGRQGRRCLGRDAG
jgi:hypothetical protein